jgi:hypothetical protein
MGERLVIDPDPTARFAAECSGNGLKILTLAQRGRSPVYGAGTGVQPLAIHTSVIPMEPCGKS